MLSVLIPLMNWNPLCLVETLVNQLIKTGKPFEILISDDSNPLESEEILKQLSDIEGVSCFSRPAPLGRSANRNFLASKAQYEYLLFIDGDAGCEDDHYIENYFKTLGQDLVLCGGTLYNNEPPKNPESILRWKYGRAREQTHAKKRQQIPWKSFSTFNFLIPASVFNTFCFDESIKGYGHEDTLFGIQLHLAGIKIVHLDNGLIHLGLESCTVYLDKIRESGHNLIDLASRNAFPNDYLKGISLLKSWKLIKKFRLEGLVSTWFKFRRKSIEKRLCCRQPSLLLLDLYKLGSISSID